VEFPRARPQPIIRAATRNIAKSNIFDCFSWVSQINELFVAKDISETHP
jgi:hypothetical protein